MMRILAVASGGGHWIQLRRLARTFGYHDVAYVSVNKDYSAEVSPCRLYTVNDANRWNKFGVMMLGLRLLCIVLKERPHVVISTGAAPGFLALLFAKCIGAKTIWIDSLANVEQMSLSGRLAQRYADLWLTQWPELESPSGPYYRGTIL
jgi:UDP-N-acetylglucosamine:LPS N-acetylglucosamine transferase